MRPEPSPSFTKDGLTCPTATPPCCHPVRAGAGARRATAGPERAGSGSGLLLCGGILAVLCLVLLGIVMATGPTGPCRSRRWGSWSALAAPALVAWSGSWSRWCRPRAPCRSYGLRRAGPSRPGARAAVLLLAWLVVTQSFLKPAAFTKARSCRAGRRGRDRGRADRRGGCLIGHPLRMESWRPPVGVQLFRRIGTLAGSARSWRSSVWACWGWRRRRRSGRPRAC